MPLGLQLIAGPGQDAALIAMALAVEPVLRGLP
jgi:Asp-tRNA(Asn)/Glu-tRNA(Gln) amidotransferase A subunit family amidase